ncbi:MAG: hypothetical protein ACTHNG_09705 [Ginsengibacter sp.]|jgi:hypothetical protein
MKVIRCCIVLVASAFVFASCHPNGHILDKMDTEHGTPSKADTVLPHKYHMNAADTVKGESENLPNVYQR